MAFFKILWRGMRDLYGSFSYFIMVSLAFWLCWTPMLLGYGFLAMPIFYWPIFLVSTILVPPALTVLFALSDPRAVVERTEWSAVPGLLRSVFVRSWKLALATIVPLVMLGWNIRFFAGSGHTLEFLVPLWAVMWMFVFVLTLYCFALAGTHESGVRNAFRGGMFTLVSYPFRSIALSVFILISGYVSSIALLPMLIIGPPFIATIVNRFVFTALDVYVIDPDAPTDEREVERQRGINPDRSLMDRVMRRGKD